MGRAGRLLESGKREQSIIYILFNDQDLGRNRKQLTESVRQICRSKDTCLNRLLKDMFVGDYPVDNQPSRGACCSVCDSEIS